MKTIVVAGAGIASISFLKGLPKEIFKKHRVILINKYDFTYQTMLLHHLACDENAKIKHKLEDVLDLTRLEFIQDTITLFDKNTIYLQNHKSIEFDYLILGLGARVNTFGIKGSDEIDNIGDYESALKTAKKLQNLNKGDRVVICGGGFSGVELAGAIVDNFKDKKLDIHIINSSYGIIHNLGKKHSRFATLLFKSKGIYIHSRQKILEFQKDKLIAQLLDVDEEHIIVPDTCPIPTPTKPENCISIGAKLFIWTAGVSQNEAMSKSFGMQKVITDEFCRVDKHIFAIGDCACFIDEKTQKPFPPTGQLAQRQGEYLAKIFPYVLKDENIPFSFKYKSLGMVCSLCDKKAVGVAFGFSVRIMANILKHFIDKKWLFKLYGLKGFLR